MTPDPSRALESRAIEGRTSHGPPNSAQWREYRERGSVRLLRFMACLSLRLGRSLSRGVLYGIAAYFLLFSPAARKHSRQFLKLALGRNPSAADRFRHILYFATCIHDRVYLLNEQFDRFDCTIEGEPFVRAQIDAGRGGFLVGAHMGSFEVMASMGRRQPGLHVSMAMYENNARKINAQLAAINADTKPDIIPLGHIDTMLAIAERLDRGAFVGMLADRTLEDEPMCLVTVLGRPTYLPTGPMRAAAILRRSVIFMAGLYRGGNRYHVVFAPIADFSAIPAGGRDAAVNSAMLRYAALIDHYCRSDPYNWFNFFDFWRERPDSSEA
jgi:predicted LPLAT superfamily acyltransferase